MGVVIFLLVAAGIAAPIVYVVVRARQYRGSEQWPVNDGVIAELDPEVRPSRQSCYAVVTYVYSVAGERFAGEWSTPWRRTEREVREMVACYLPRGKAVKVQYDPRNPETSLMVDPGVPSEYDPIALKIE